MSDYLPLLLRAQVREIYAGRCAYCQAVEALSVVPFEMDHIVPVSAGGSDELDNLCLACPTCNRYKAARQIAPDPESSRVVALYHPRQNSWTDHFAWNADGTTVVGKTPTGRATIEALRMNRPHLQQLRRLWRRLNIEGA